ncbi:MAG: hypothetical protein HYU86_10935 [Chloroflexi bacterium]|nr:hypothetical protein [Chloroflexota bacterium]
MGQCALIVCPQCQKEFIVSPHMLGLGVEFHCPFCDNYFPQEASPKVKV